MGKVVAISNWEDNHYVRHSADFVCRHAGLHNPCNYSPIREGRWKWSGQRGRRITESAVREW